jgi:hypothetical protein
MFPSEVKEKAMVACQRRCCLCHKYCGVGMECHHIVEAAQGGEDTFDNCIPLCFDCHAVVGHYNNKHPKGIKFSASELRTHRDRWYSKAQAISSENSSDNTELDVKLFNKVCQTLGGSTKMLHFRDHDYGNLYPQDVAKRVDDFFNYSQLPEWEFFNTQMDCSLSDLRSAIGKYVKNGQGRIWWESDGWAGVPQEWQDSQEPRFDEAVSTMNRVATEVWDAYTLFVREGRRVLKVDPEE